MLLTFALAMAVAVALALAKRTYKKQVKATESRPKQTKTSLQKAKRDLVKSSSAASSMEMIVDAMSVFAPPSSGACFTCRKLPCA